MSSHEKQTERTAWRGQRISSETLREIVAEHALWHDSNGTRGARANLSGADLESVDLQRVVRQGANLVGARLNGANLSRGDLRRADAQDVACSRANLAGCRLAPGDDLYERIANGIHGCDKLILIASRSSLTSPWVNFEIEELLRKERQLEQERGISVRALVSLDLDGYLLRNYDGRQKAVICSRAVADFTDPARFSTEVERLVQSLRVDGAGRELRSLSRP